AGSYRYRCSGAARRGGVRRAPRATFEPMASTTTAAHATASDLAAPPDDRPGDPRLPARGRRAARASARHLARRPGSHRPARATDPLAAQGEYLVRLAAYNDCHPPGYAERGGDVPTSEWLVGSPLGHLGRWGTSYPTNQRLSIGALGEEEWLAYTANLHTRPLMPDFALRQMRERDRRAIYRFVRSLGQAGKP